MAKNGITVSTSGLTKLINGLKRVGSVINGWFGKNTDIPIDLKKIERDIRIITRWNLRKAGFRNTSRVRDICNRFTVTNRQTARTIFVSVEHMSATDNKILQNYSAVGRDHTIRESAVLKILLYGRPKHYVIPRMDNNNAHVLKWSKGGTIHFHNWRLSGRINVPNKATFLSNVSGDDPYKTKSVIRDRLTSIIDKDFKILRTDLDI